MQLRTDEFWAVKDVSFELRRGECLGLIGHNGAGKTTLLKMLNGLIKPDAGAINIRGRVGALIALGAGFNPILTGRENIFVNASVLGLSKKETSDKIEEIIDFAEIGEFIDMPVQNYSSGMTVRLGFAVATAMNPDVLILDEVLAVGDARFRNKCYNKIGKMHSHAATIFVSHAMDQVAQVCDRVLVMHHGCPCYVGDVSAGVAMYEQLNTPTESDERNGFCNLHEPVSSAKIQVTPANIQHGSGMTFTLSVFSDAAINNACLRVVFYNEIGVPCAEWNSYRLKRHIDILPGLSILEVDLGPILFKRGEYKLGINLTDCTGTTLLVWSFKEHSVLVDALSNVGPLISFEGELRQFDSVGLTNSQST